MAITPQEAIGQKLEMESAAILALEKRIESTLKNKYDGRGSVSVDISSVSKFVWEVVKENFEKAGWKVERSVGGDQRDSWDDLVFSAK